MPPAEYGRAGHPGGELRRAVAGEHEMAVAVDEAGHHAPAVGIDGGVGRRRLSGPDLDDFVADHDHPGVAELAGRARADHRVVGEQPADPLDDGRAGTHRSTAPRRGDRPVECRRDVDSLMGSVVARRRRRRRPRAHVGRHAAANTTAASGSRQRSEPARRGLSNATVDEVGQRADRQAASAGPPEAFVARSRGGTVSRSAGRWVPRRSDARRSSSSIALVSSNGSITAWESEPTQRSTPASRQRRVGPIPSASSRSVVGQMQQRDRRAAPASRCPPHRRGWHARP